MLMQVNIPLPLQVVIDDVGWWSGEDGHARQEPYRSGSGRAHVPADYAAIVSLGEQLGMRPMAALILCEWDRENHLRRVPSATWMGAQWDNRRWVGPWLDEVAAILGAGADHVEIALHGVGHEFWQNGVFTRAEWHDQLGAMRPAQEVRAHLDAFAHILTQNGLGGFPQSFVPAAFCHAIGDGPGGLAAVLHEVGIRRIATPKAVVRDGYRFAHPLLGVDQGTLTLLQPHAYRYPWYDVATQPVHEISGPLLGLHWPNLLHKDPARNAEAVTRWVEFLRPYGQRPDRMLAPDGAACWAQLAHHGLARLTQDGDHLEIDVSPVRRLGAAWLPDSFALRCECQTLPALTWTGAEVLAQRQVAPGCHEITLRVSAADGVAEGTP
jgi:hypothetical protein